MEVRLRDGESFESMLRRFKTGVEKEGILSDYKRHQSYMSKSEKIRAKMKRAQRKRRGRASRAA
jgi:small subunit ribosomal protein S21